MDMQTFKRLRPSFSSADLVFLQGWGEPLLHPEFWEMVGQAKAAGAVTGFTTNAKLLDQTCALRLVDSGVDVMAVSLAGATPESHERFRPGCSLAQIEGALTGLRELKRGRGLQKPYVHVAFMLLQSNWREVDGLVELAGRWGATQVVVSNLTWIGTAAMREESMLERRDLWPEVTTLLEQARRDASEKGIEFCYRDPGTRHPRPACTENVLKACFVSPELCTPS